MVLRSGGTGRTQQNRLPRTVKSSAGDPKQRHEVLLSMKGMCLVTEALWQASVRWFGEFPGMESPTMRPNQASQLPPAGAQYSGVTAERNKTDLD